MRFDSGLLNHCGDVTGYPRIEEWKESALLMESLGYTAVWSAEHHFFWDGWTNPVPTNPLLFGAFIAGQTKKLKLAQCGVCLPDWHPIRAAEDVSMLDHMSNGRVEFGALPGVNNRVNGNFNRNADRRNKKVSRALYWETLDIIQLAWKGEPFKFKGEFYEFPMPGWFDQKRPLNTLDPRFFTKEGELTHLQLIPTPGLPHEVVPGSKLASGRRWPGSDLAEAERRAEQMLAARSFRGPVVDSRVMSAV